ncbi:MAG: hypothetical protein ABJ205_09700 [Erythrobacter sp.]|uniref:hypothetical protein n=1 Tax=Erythrobacter sp. TaxID=1042 RepID=UPI00326536DD
MTNANSKLLQELQPSELSHARALTHRAAQHLTGLARANIEAKPDDSHSNLGWDQAIGGLRTHAIGDVVMALKFSPLALIALKDGEPVEELLLHGKTVAQAEEWTDQTALSLGLSAASAATIPYDLPDDVATISTYDTVDAAEQLRAVGEWFNLAASVLEALAAAEAGRKPGPSPVRCWPHHFDIATYVALEEGDPETARGIGVGMSPGDEGHDEPYFYINPWPHLDKASLPEPTSPGYWHVDGYVGLVATATSLQATGFVAGSTSDFINYGFRTAFDAQWAD